MQEIIHIIPVGYEFDRIIKPFLGPTGLRANQVYLLSSIHEVEAPGHIRKKHEKYVKKASKALAELGITVHEKPCNLIKLKEVIQITSRIIKTEKEKGNLVYLNMSGAGRLTSVGITLSAMAHDVVVYYVNSDGYSDTEELQEIHGYTIVKEPRIDYLNNFIIETPPHAQLLTLVEILNRGKMDTEEIIDYLNANGFDFIRKDDKEKDKKPNIRMRVQRNVLDKLLEKGYISKTSVGRRKEYNLTETGVYMASISGLIAEGN